MDLEDSELFGSLMNSLGGGDPYSKEMDEYGNVKDLFKNTFNPYMNAGKTLQPELINQFSHMMNNPGMMLQKLGENYKQSPGYSFSLNQGLDAANRASASHGMNGTPANQLQLQQIGQHLASQDYNDYLNHALGIFNSGTGGLMNMENQGFHGAEDYATGMGQYYNTMAQLKAAQAQQEAQKKAADGGLFGGIGYDIGSLL
jgi:hypothetical protein